MTEILPALKGSLLALLAAVLFGVSTPLVQIFGRGLGPFWTAALLYLGAAVIGAAIRKAPSAEARLRLTDLPRLSLMAICGAVIGPVALAWGLQHTGGTGASMMLALEALFTAILARLLYGETFDLKVWIAMALLLAGGVALVLDQGYSGGASPLGLLAVVAATAAWGADNTLSRVLAERDPGQVVLAKAVLGAGVTTAIAFVMNEPSPALPAAIGLFIVGATGYGLSLRFYLLAQRAFGAGRTGSVFAFAPFIGASLAILLGDRSGGWMMIAGGGLMALGVVLHLAESHAHEHVHDAMSHEHAHTHDDGHHTHWHEAMPSSSHSHAHTHQPLIHTHAHVPDAHHQHPH